MRRLMVILGVPIDDLTMEETLDRLEEFILIGRATGRWHQVVTINTDFLVKAARDQSLQHMLQEADLATADGMPLVWGARLLGMPWKERVAGSDMVPLLAQRAARGGYSLYLLGAGPGIAASAARMMQQRAPGLKIVGIQSPNIKDIEDTDAAILEDIRAARPDVLLVALGNPKQEKWIRRFGPELNVPVMIGVGGTLDLVAGKLPRAPRWMQKSGLEWVWRLALEPGRLWKRYFTDLFVFSFLFLRQFWMTRFAFGAPAVLPLTDIFLMQDAVIMNVQGPLTAANLASFNQTSHRVLSVANNIIVNLEKATFLDSAAMGALVGLAREARQAGGDIWLTSAPPVVLNALKLLRLDSFFQVLPDLRSCLAACRKHSGAHLVSLTRSQQ